MALMRNKWTRFDTMFEKETTHHPSGHIVHSACPVVLVKLPNVHCIGYPVPSGQ